MTNEQRSHLSGALAAFKKQAEEKYKKGVAEHGGNMWLKPGMLDQAMDEVVDLWLYLYTIQVQWKARSPLPITTEGVEKPLSLASGD